MAWDLSEAPPTVHCDIGGDSLCSGLVVLDKRGSSYGASRMLNHIPLSRHGPYRIDYTLANVFDEPILTIQLVDLFDIAIIERVDIGLTGDVGRIIDLVSTREVLLQAEPVIFQAKPIDFVSIGSVVDNQMGLRTSPSDCCTAGVAFTDDGVLSVTIVGGLFDGTYTLTGSGQLYTFSLDGGPWACGTHPAETVFTLTVQCDAETSLPVLIMDLALNRESSADCTEVVQLTSDGTTWSGTFSGNAGSGGCACMAGATVTVGLTCGVSSSSSSSGTWYCVKTCSSSSGCPDGFCDTYILDGSIVLNRQSPCFSPWVSSDGRYVLSVFGIDSDRWELDDNTDPGGCGGCCFWQTNDGSTFVPWNGHGCTTLHQMGPPALCGSASRTVCGCADSSSSSSASGNCIFQCVQNPGPSQTIMSGPYFTQQQCQLVCGCSSSSCHVDVALVGECGFEVSGGTVYAIGSQSVDIVLTDPCDCVVDVLLNGEETPADVADGEEIVIELVLQDGCWGIDADAPVCRMPMMFTLKRSDGGRKTYLSMVNLLRSARRRILRR